MTTTAIIGAHYTHGTAIEVLVLDRVHPDAPRGQAGVDYIQIDGADYIVARRFDLVMGQMNSQEYLTDSRRMMLVEKVVT